MFVKSNMEIIGGFANIKRRKWVLIHDSLALGLRLELYVMIKCPIEKYD
jgi:hypothetical protein